MARKVWNWNNFRGGLSDYADMITQSDMGKFQQGSYWIDPLTEPGGVKLSSTVADLWTVDGEPKVILDLAAYGSSGIIVATSTGKIYLNWTLKHTLVAADKNILSAWVVVISGTTYVYYFTNTVIHRSNTAVTTVTEWVLTMWTESTFHPTAEYGWAIYVGSSQYVYKVDNTGSLSTALTLDAPSAVVRGLTIYQDQMKIYASLWGTHGVQYIWNLVSASTQYRTIWNNLPFLGATNVGATDYVVTLSVGTSSDLYMVQGTQRQLVISNYENSSGRNFNGVMTSVLDDVYLGGTYASTGTVYKYGQFFPNFNKAIYEDARIGANYTVRSIMGRSDYVYMGVYSGSTYKLVTIDKATPPTNNKYTTTGECISQVFTGWSVWTNKSLTEIKISFDGNNTSIFKHGGTIALSARKDSNISWTSITSFACDGLYYKTITANELRALWFGDFNQLELKLTLTAGQVASVNTYTPLVREVQVSYDDNIR